MSISRRAFIVGGAGALVSGCGSTIGRGPESSSKVPEGSIPPGPPPGEPNPPSKLECKFGSETSLKVGEACLVFPGVVAVKEGVVLRPILRMHDNGGARRIQVASGRDKDGTVKLRDVEGIQGWRITQLGMDTPPLSMMQNDGCVDPKTERRVKVPLQMITLERSFDFEGITVPVFEPGTAEKDLAPSKLWNVGGFATYISLHNKTAESLPSDLRDYKNQALNLS